MGRRDSNERKKRVLRFGAKPDMGSQNAKEIVSELEKRVSEVYADLLNLKKSIVKQSSENIKKIEKMEEILSNLVFSLKRSGKEVSFKESSVKIKEITKANNIVRKTR